jgi:hypothetical protein
MSIDCEHEKILPAGRLKQVARELADLREEVKMLRAQRGALELYAKECQATGTGTMDPDTVLNDFTDDRSAREWLTIGGKAIADIGRFEQKFARVIDTAKLLRTEWVLGAVKDQFDAPGSVRRLGVAIAKVLEIDLSDFPPGENPIEKDFGKTKVVS